MIGGGLGAKDRQFRSEPMFEVRDRDFVDGPAAVSQDVESGVEDLADLRIQHVEIVLLRDPDPQSPRRMTDTGGD